MQSSEAIDEAVRATNCEACGGKVSAVRKGYWSDAALLRLAAAARQRPSKKPPEINRGYYARVAAVRDIVRRFVAAAGGAEEAQIVNLGCGFDALYWTLREEGHRVRAFVELDFPAVAHRKAQAIRRDAQLLAALDAPQDALAGSGDLLSARYRLHGCDLRSVADVRAALRDLDRAAPTLFLAECVLVYVEPRACRELLAWIAADFAQAAFASYEQVNLGDAFGRVMKESLVERGCPLVGADACASLDAQNQRFLSCGWDRAISRDMEAAWHALPADDRRRVESIEMLDERELLFQLLQHYCIVLATRGDRLAALSF